MTNPAARARRERIARLRRLVATGAVAVLLAAFAAVAAWGVQPSTKSASTTAAVQGATSPGDGDQASGSTGTWSDIPSRSGQSQDRSQSRQQAEPPMTTQAS